MASQPFVRGFNHPSQPFVRGFNHPSRPAVRSDHARRSFGQFPPSRRSFGQFPPFVRAVSTSVTPFDRTIPAVPSGSSRRPAVRSANSAVRSGSSDVRYAVRSGNSRRSSRRSFGQFPPFVRFGAHPFVLGFCPFCSHCDVFIRSHFGRGSYHGVVQQHASA